MNKLSYYLCSMHLFRTGILLFFLISGPGILSLRAQLTFEKCFGWVDDDYITGGTRLSDGGFIVCGTTTDTISMYTEGLILRIDTMGNVIWTSRSELHFPDQTQVAVDETFDHHLVSVGKEGIVSTYGKWSPGGTNLWRYPQYDLNQIYGITATRDSCFSFVGTVGKQISVIKADSAGNILWNKTTTNGTSVAGYDIIQTMSGGYAVCGTRELMQYPAFVDFAMVLKPDGSLWWQHFFDESGASCALQIMQMPDQGFVFCGWHGHDAILTRVNYAGQVIWRKCYQHDYQESFSAVDTVTGGGFICCGYTQKWNSDLKDVLLVRIDTAGDTLWTKTFGGPLNDVGVTVHSMPDGGFFISGYTNSFWNNGYDLYFIRTDKNGNVEEKNRLSHSAVKP